MSRVQPPGVPVPFAQPFGRANSWPGCGHVVSDGAMKSSIVNHVFGKWLTNVVAVVRSVQSAGSGGEVARAVRRREDGDGVAERAELRRDTRHVFVDVVRLRPGERRDETDAQSHVVRV